MKNEGFGKGYKYAHDFEGGIIGQVNVPENIQGRQYYEPTDRGLERELGNRMQRIREVYRRTQQQARIASGKEQDSP